jgi:tetratricopeptide (TPR) repeat protein
MLFMQIGEKSRQEIEMKLSQMSDFLKMEYLEACAKQHREFDIKKFCNMKLAELYEKRNMFSEAAKNASAAAEMAATYNEKMQSYMKEVELWVKAGHYDNIDGAFKKALASGNAKEKEEMKKALKSFYQKQAEAYERMLRRENALKIYQRMLELSDNESEKLGIKRKILDLYKTLGKIREYTILRDQLDKSN